MCEHKHIRFCRVPGCERHAGRYCEDCNAPVSEQFAIACGAETPGRG